MVLEAAMQLLIVLQQKPQLNDDDFGLIRALSSYIEMHIRTATVLFERQLNAEGITRDDLEGFTP